MPYVSVSLRPPREGVGLVELPGTAALALTWNGCRVGTATAEEGGYRVTPNPRARRVLGGRVGAGELALLAQRWAGAAVPTEPGANCPRCGSEAYVALWHDPTGQLEGHECRECGLETGPDGRAS